MYRHILTKLAAFLTGNRSWAPDFHKTLIARPLFRPRFISFGLSLGFSFALLWLMNAAAIAQTPVKIMAFGDSLSAGYMLANDAAFPTQLEKALQAKGHKVEVINAGVSGDTSSGGLDRLEWSLTPEVKFVILELGANDALRGLDPAITRKNLDAMLNILAKKGVKTLIAGMYAPRNNGPEYTAQFDAIYPELSKKYNLPLYPFFMEGVLGDQTLLLKDMIHPNKQGVERIVSGILPFVEALLK